MPSLDQLQTGQRARIDAVRGDDAVGQRLLEMGMLEGDEVEVVGFAPLGDATSATKQAIFSGNATRFYKIKLRAADNTRMPTFSEDRLAALKHEYAQAASQPSNLRYGYVRAG